MDLKMKDITELLDVPEKTIVDWIKDKKMPAHKIKNQYFFNKAEINEWILRNNIAVSSKILELGLTAKPVSILDLVNKGGIYYKIEGSTVKDVINSVVATIRIPKSLSKEDVRRSLVQREEMMSTAIGKGIAFPHPRNPIISDVEDEGVSICFLKNRVDYQAIDGIPVQVLFIIISSNAKRHLEILSKLSFLCQQQDFAKIVNDQAKPDVVLYYIEQKEKEWSNK